MAVIAEIDAIDGLRPDGHARRRKGKTDQMFFRVTPEKKAQLHRLSELLSAGKPENVSYTETIERALDALEDKIKGQANIARPIEEWHEDIGSVLWWFFPMTEAPYVGTPLDCGQTVEVVTRYYEQCEVVEKLSRYSVGGWPGYHTHFTPIPPVPEVKP